MPLALPFTDLLVGDILGLPNPYSLRRAQKPGDRQASCDICYAMAAILDQADYFTVDVYNLLRGKLWRKDERPLNVFRLLPSHDEVALPGKHREEDTRQNIFCKVCPAKKMLAPSP